MRVCNRSFTLRVVPQMWKTSCVLLVSKNNTHEYPEQLQNSGSNIASDENTRETGPGTSPLCDWPIHEPTEIRLPACHVCRGCRHLPSTLCSLSPWAAWRHFENHFFLIFPEPSKTNEMVLDFRRCQPAFPSPGNFQRIEIETVLLEVPGFLVDH